MHLFSWSLIILYTITISTNRTEALHVVSVLPCFSSFKGREIGNEKLIGILDLQHITYGNIDARGLITGFQFLQVTGISFMSFICDKRKKAKEFVQLKPSRLKKARNESSGYFFIYPMQVGRWGNPPAPTSTLLIKSCLPVRLGQAHCPPGPMLVQADEPGRLDAGACPAYPVTFFQKLLLFFFFHITISCLPPPSGHSWP